MEVERDIAGIALPFAAGVAASAFSGGLICSHPHLSASLASLILLSTFCLLMHPCHRNLSSASLRPAICLCLSACGIMCGISAEILSAGGSSPLIDLFAATGSRMEETIDALDFESSDTNALIKALIAGDRSDIPAHITETFRKSGASHILALSGLHLGIIYGLIVKTLSIIGNSYPIRIFRSCITVAACGLYTLATGAGPSIVRAFLFITIGEVARISGRGRKTGVVLLASLTLHLIITPGCIREAGFQLSYAAMAGIAFIFPWLSGFWPDKKHGPMRWIWNTAALSISCQITTAPIAYMYFGTFPVHFLLTNLIAIPLTGLIIPFVLTVILLSGLNICPDILPRASEMLVTALSEALEVIASM